MLHSRALIRAAPQPLQVAFVDHLSHAVKVNQKTQKHFIRRRTVLVYATQIAQNRDAGHVLAVECQNAGGLRTQTGGAFGRRDMSMYMFMLHVIRGRDFRQQACDHLNDVRHRHGADLVLASDLLSRPSGPLRLCQELFTRKALDMREVAHLDPAGG